MGVRILERWQRARWCRNTRVLFVWMTLATLSCLDVPATDATASAAAAGPMSGGPKPDPLPAAAAAAAAAAASSAASSGLAGSVGGGPSGGGHQPAPGAASGSAGAPPPPPPPPVASAAAQTLSSRVVRTKYGDVSGLIVTFDSRHLEPVEVFRGVPYASPPKGTLRFMPPVSGARWSGVKAADRFGPVCPQRLPDISNETAALRRMPRGRLEYLKRLLPYLQNQSEDCLFLNIYAPAQVGARESGGASRYPVMVYVHGDSYEWSSGNPYDGSVLASYGGVVVVTINYRLGVLGFLNANTDVYLRSPANYGLMDQIAALHWIQENIAVFGGDPSNVTLVGHGTGAACVHLLMTSSAVPDGMLFHRAVLMSGSALSPWALVESPARYAQQVARHANCSPELPHPSLLKCLRDRPLDVLMSAPVEAPQFSVAFGPSVDGVVVDSGDPPGGGGGGGGGGSGGDGSSGSGSGANGGGTGASSGGGSSSTGGGGGGAGGWNGAGGSFVNSVLLRKSVVSKLSRYDLLLGVVKAEAYFAFSGEDVQYGIEADRRAKILRTFVRNTYRFHLSEILATIVNEYTDWERPVQHPINIRDETLEALSDAQVVAPVVQTADLHSAARRNSYLYVFDYQTKYGDYPQRQGCIHGEELPYVFGAPLVGGLAHFPRNYTKTEVLLAEAAIIYWSNFARTGNPNEPQEPDLVHGARQERNRFKNIEWTAYEAVHKKYLNLDTKPKVKTHYRAHRLSFWLNLVPDLHRPGGDDVPASHHRLPDDDGAPPPLPPLITSRPLPPAAAPDAAAATPTPPAASPGDNATAPSQPPAAANEDSASAISASAAAPPQQQEDGFAAYSTALSVTIAIGCSLLILNVLIFAGVYYQRDKTRLQGGGGGGGGGGPGGGGVGGAAAVAGKKRSENGQMPNSICGDLLVADSGKGDPHGPHHHHSHHHQMPPPEFADLPSAAAGNGGGGGPGGGGGGVGAPTPVAVPRPPPPPKTPKPAAIPALSATAQPESQPLLPPHAIPLLAGGGSGTLTKKKGAAAAAAGAAAAAAAASAANKMEELRV